LKDRQPGGRRRTVFLPDVIPRSYLIHQVPEKVERTGAERAGRGPDAVRGSIIAVAWRLGTLIQLHQTARTVVMLFMIIERFKDRSLAPIYERLREQGRALPDGLRYIESWVEANFERCFQVMECDDVVVLHRWVLEWRDLVDFEIVPVSPSRAVRELFSAAGESRRS
jgi:hypothetical protein